VLSGEQVPVPAQDRVWAYQQPQPAQRLPRHRLQQRRQQRPVGRVEPDTSVAKLPLKDAELVP
jgi:hypothetical protein